MTDDIEGPELTPVARQVLRNLRDGDMEFRWRPSVAVQWGLARWLERHEFITLDLGTGVCTITSRGRAALDKTS